MSVVVISTVTFVLSTMPELTDNIDIMLFDNETDVSTNNTDVPFITPVERWEEVSPRVIHIGQGTSPNEGPSHLSQKFQVPHCSWLEKFPIE